MDVLVAFFDIIHELLTIIGQVVFEQLIVAVLFGIVCAGVAYYLYHRLTSK